MLSIKKYKIKKIGNKKVEQQKRTIKQ
jgi:hypothetical protein